MFNFSEWVVKGVIDGYKTGLTPFAKVTELVVDEPVVEESEDI